ncbi:unnamed protein product [Ambrosiozyma monospora]|uniref:Unnamed protein product n=1 Tax=Ambrosiozyma monospora TaxID=43982 RepID=A0ACB5U8V9_AMBMO|nr:unnamed protein product [Ambrosiozyma monospora]
MTFHCRNSVLSCGVGSMRSMVPDELADYLYKYAKPHIVASSQAQNRTVYGREEIDKLREFVHTPKNSLDLLNMKG